SYLDCNSRITSSEILMAVASEALSAPGAQMSRTLHLDITGMTCAACAARVEKVLERQPGVGSASVNLPLESAAISVAEGVTPGALVAAVEAAGYGAHVRPEDSAARRAEREASEARASAAERRTLAVLGLSAVLTVPLVLPMVLAVFGIDWMLAPLVQLALATPVQILAGGRFYVGAFKALRGGGANMDV